MTQIRLRQTQTQTRSLVTLRLARFVPGHGGWVTESTYSLWSHSDLVYSHSHRTAVAVWLARICRALATPAPDWANPPDPHLVGEAAANRLADPGT